MASVIDTANALVSLDDAKTFCAVDLSDDTYDDDITEFVNAVSVMFNTITRRSLLSRDHSEYHDGDGGAVLFLDNYPVSALTHLYIDPDRAYGAETEIASGDYALYADIGKVRLISQVFDKGPLSIKAVYTAGYELADVPADLRLACLDQIKFQFRKWKDNREAVISANLEGQSVTLREIKDILPSVKIVLDLYKRVGHG